MVAFISSAFTVWRPEYLTSYCLLVTNVYFVTMCNHMIIPQKFRLISTSIYGQSSAGVTLHVTKWKHCMESIDRHVTHFCALTSSNLLSKLSLKLNGHVFHTLKHLDLFQNPTKEASSYFKIRHKG